MIETIIYVVLFLASIYAPLIISIVAAPVPKSFYESSTEAETELQGDS
jgi:hypothetical protein